MSAPKWTAVVPTANLPWRAITRTAPKDTVPSGIVRDANNEEVARTSPELAHFVAAAPELYAALDDVLTLMLHARQVYGCRTVVVCADFEQRIRSALGKAGGA